MLRLKHPIEGERSQPSSHLITGIALRALAAHPRYRRSPEARAAARLLASRFFQADRYLDHGRPEHWTKLAFPFRWTDIASALDVIALTGVAPTEPDVARGLDWLLGQQKPNGLWHTGYPKTRDPLVDHWVTFGVARVFKRFFGVGALLGAGGHQPPVEVGRRRAVAAAR